MEKNINKPTKQEKELERRHTGGSKGEKEKKTHSPRWLLRERKEGARQVDRLVANEKRTLRQDI